MPDERTQQRPKHHSTPRASLREYGRGVAGGLLFSLPLIYTMEVWWAGFILSPLRLALFMLATFVLLLGYNHEAGIRYDASWTEVAIDSIEEMGIGLLIAAVMLYLLGQITLDMPTSEIMGKIVVESMVTAIGVSVGTAQLGASGNGQEEGDGSSQTGSQQQERGQRNRPEHHFPLSELLVTMTCGAILFAANVAPTEEIIMIAFESTLPRLLGLAVCSLLLSGLILYFSDFVGSQRTRLSRSGPQIAGSICLCYAVALGTSALILWFLGRFDDLAPLQMVTTTIVLGVPASMGAAAGRLLLGGD